ncbi:hypothetical protein CHS0354_006624, partial [Potamilus streckersoni]
NGGNLTRHHSNELETFTKTYIDVKEKKMPAKKTATYHSALEITISQHIIGYVDTDTVKPVSNLLFSFEKESRPVQLISLLAKAGYGYIRPDVCNLASDSTDKIGICQKNNPLSLQLLIEMA